MDFLRRDANNNQPQTVRSNTGGQTPPHTSDSTEKNKAKLWCQPKWLRVTGVVLLFSLTGLAIAIILLFYMGKPKEAHFVDKTKEQAVFLTNGQVYFGHVTEITDKYVSLVGIYYLNSS